MTGRTAAPIALSVLAAAFSLPAVGLAELKPEVMKEMEGVAESCGQFTAKAERCYAELGYDSIFVKSGFLKWARSKGASKEELDALSVQFEKGLMRGGGARCEAPGSAERAANLEKYDEIVDNCSRPRR